MASHCSVTFDRLPSAGASDRLLVVKCGMHDVCVEFRAYDWKRDVMCHVVKRLKNLVNGEASGGGLLMTEAAVVQDER